MRFSPLQLYASLREPLIYFFSNYAPANIVYSEDETKTELLITSRDNYYEIKDQVKPRILIDRGGFSMNYMGLNNSMATSNGPWLDYGLSNNTNIIQIEGRSQYLIEARNSGTCELLADIVSHFLMWSSALLCTSLGFKKFATPLIVSACVPTKEDTGLFQVTIDVPWVTEELWTTSQTGVKLKNFLLTFNPASVTGSVSSMTATPNLIVTGA
jgi:hypothetical protein